MAIRSGRFIGGAKSKLTIIKGTGGTYRIFNSGYHAFDVMVGGKKLASVPPDCSVDVRPTKGSGEVVIYSANAIEGSYEYLSEHSRIRSGRFAKLINPLDIVNESNAKATAFYRVLNSGSNNFTVKRKNSSATKKPVDLAPRMSIDVELSKEGLSIEPSGGKPVEGIYFHLDQIQDLRSGRFKIDPAAGKPAPNPYVPHTIIDADSKGESASYRIFNSGDYAFKLLGVSAFPNGHTINKGMSCDFVVANGDSIIQVQGLNAKEAIEGIYDWIEPSR